MLSHEALFGGLHDNKIRTIPIPKIQTLKKYLINYIPIISLYFFQFQLCM